jgi:GxxExxY protein
MREKIEPLETSTPRQPPDRRLDALTKVIVAAGRKVHRALGPGLLEPAYEHCLARELDARGVAFRREAVAPVAPEDADHAYGCRLDFVVAGVIVVEIGAVDAPTRLDTPEVRAHLRRSGYRLALRLDFNAARFSQGVERFEI